ncbi:MBOAT family protein [Acuticoccus sp. I52.16.1]|uniref:MBOAT family O-acyltransferase n=1 Tax=Acuticoccus sp. I52.16.1 TaxID=2928472 RepID=UPI001FD1ACAC|nr:MBOAT family protein [Acuticoccus sp. I52.16.1]UOM36772.1 MBOAT family protein [Acuticoccus sp. I52.16.1]
MLFTTLEYWIFFFVVFVLYHLLAHRAQNLMLLVASYVFYAAWDWRYAGLMALSTAIAYGAGLAVEDHRAGHRRRAALTSAVVANLAVLAAFKYWGFIVDVIGDLLNPGADFYDNISLSVLLPVGISFYTFQSISYVVDVARGEIRAARNPLDLALYVSLFPQLVAGPIERGAQLMPQVINRRPVNLPAMRSALWLIAWGLYKKICIADTLAHPVNAVFATSDPTGPEVYVAAVCFALQIYCDFSGYTDIARGCARLIGFELMLNFNLPYIARNPSDFWRRWHISLSTWLRDYLYIPLGGSRRGPGRTTFNLMATMVLGGLWHGARYNFILWGAYHGAILVAHRVISGRLTGRGSRLGIVLSVLVMFQFTLFGWLLFRVETIEQLSRMMGALATGWSSAGVAGDILLYALPTTVPLLFIEAWQVRASRLDVVERSPWPVHVALVSLALAAAVILDRSGAAPFIYFQF